jgi:hypothetical protein
MRQPPFAGDFPELARLLRETIERLPSLDPESLRLLGSAANRLDLPEYAPIVHCAATRLDLPEYTPALHHAAINLELPEYAPMLTAAADKLDLANQVPRLHDVAETLRGSIESMSDAAHRIETAAYAARPGPAGRVEVRYVRWIPWQGAVACLVGWAFAILLIYLHAKGRF